jgi:hypothetical protein
MQRVEAVPGTGSDKFQRITIHTADGVTTFPDNINWTHVEANGHWSYIHSQALVSGGERLQDHRFARLSFLLHRIGATRRVEQDVGGLGPFYYDNWTLVSDPAHRPDPLGNDGPLRGYLQFPGEDDCNGNNAGYQARVGPSQLYLSNALAFLDADKEWYFEPETHKLYLITSGDPNNLDVVLPIAQQLLFLSQAKHLRFIGLDFAYTYQPLPLEADGATRGYIDIYAQWAWNDSAPLLRSNQAAAVVTFRGAEDCVLQQCRVAHGAGSGVIIGTYTANSDNVGDGGDEESDDPTTFVECRNCALNTCEVFDLGAHGVYVGDEYTARDHQWSLSPTVNYPDPTDKITVQFCRIENCGVTYQDCVGIYAAHTHDLSLARNEVSFGNYTGIAIGSYLAHYFSPETNFSCMTADPCVGGSVTAYQGPNTDIINTEGSHISHNEVHDVMLKHMDGGGIYIIGSNLPSQTYPNYGSELSYNYLHDIVLNPNLNAYPYSCDPVTHELTYADARSMPAQRAVKGFYFEAGSDSWHVFLNYVENTQAQYSFGAGYNWVPEYGGCAYVPSGFRCDTTNAGCPPPSYHPVSDDDMHHPWRASSWAGPATICAGFVVPGQIWPTAGPNYWYNPPSVASACGPQTLSAYGLYEQCDGYGFPSIPSLAVRGGMYLYTAPLSSANQLLTAHPVPGDFVYDTIIRQSGIRAYPYYPTWYDQPKRIHRTPRSAGDPIDPRSQVQ